MNSFFFDFLGLYHLSFTRSWAFFLIPTPFFIYFISLLFHHFSPNFFSVLSDPKIKKRQSLNIPKISQFGILLYYQSSRASNKINFTNWILAIFIWFLMMIALANPVRISEPISISREARDLMIAIDLSHSMASNDFNFQNQIVDRLSATKWVVNAFLEQRKGDRVGLILFADRAFSQSPLTFDLESIKTFVDEAQVGLVGEKTAIGDAIVLAVRRYSGIDSNDPTHFRETLLSQQANQRENKQSGQVLILLTDGANTTGVFSPLEAAELAKEVGLKIYPISIGPDFITQRLGFVVRQIPRSEYADEQTLVQIAQMTGGKHFFAGNAKELDEVYKLINNLEPIEQENRVFRYQTSFFHYPLALCLFFFLVLVYRINRELN